MVARLFAFVIWALVAATVVFWGLRLMAHAPAAPAYAAAVGENTTAKGDLSRLLGAEPAPQVQAAALPESSARFHLLGIMAPRRSASAQVPSGGVALIAVDGKLARAYPVGAHLDPQLVLQSVSLRTVAIGPEKGATSITLALPPPTAAAVGTLPPPGSAAPGLFVPPAPVQGAPAPGGPGQMLNVPLNFNGGAPAAGNAPTNPVLNPAVNPVMNPGLGGQNNRDEPHGPGGG